MEKKVSIVTAAGNAGLALFKFLVGIFAHSGAMISDAAHSLSDIFTTIVAYIGIRMSKKEADRDHPYGHERFECVAALILSIILMLTGIGIGYGAIRQITGGNYEDIAVPHISALVAAVISIIVKEAMFWYTRYYAKLMNSSAFMADAWHHRTDAVSSVGALVGIIFARAGFTVMDPVASVSICLFILKASADIIRDTIGKMTDHACSYEYEEKIKKFILESEGVLDLTVIRTRMFGNRIYVEAEISVDGRLSLREAHDIAESVHDRLERNFTDVKHIMIHVNPA